MQHLQSVSHCFKITSRPNENFFPVSFQDCLDPKMNVAHSGKSDSEGSKTLILHIYDIKKALVVAFYLVPPNEKAF